MVINNNPQLVDWCIANFKGGDFRFTSNHMITVDSIGEKEGTQIEIKNPKLLFVQNKIVTDPKILSKVVIKATIMKHQRAKKVIVFKCRRRKNSRRKNGHRQDQSVIRIDSIVL
jgi:large subunit ribosomal protein L21